MVDDTNRKQNPSNRDDFKQQVRLSLCNCENAKTSNLNKGNENGLHGPPPPSPANLTNESAECSLTLKNKKKCLK